MKKSLAYTLFAAAVYATVTALARLSAPARLRPGQVAIITGGSRGLGLALAHRFGRAGLKLVLAARKEDELEQARQTLLSSDAVAHEDDILLVAADLTEQAQCAGVVDAALRVFGRLDVLVNNAGIIDVGPIENQSIEIFEQTMRTNFFAALYIIHAALPHLLAQRSGSIVNISSIGGKVPVPHMLPYTAAKFALAGFSEGLHAELRHKGIRVTTVCPGLLRSGGENHAKFVGRADEEKQWFDFGAKTPGIAASVGYAANRIFAAANAGSAELIITPQAWLAARGFGLAPATTLYLASLVNQYVLPAPLLIEEHSSAVPPDPAPAQEQQPTLAEEADPSPS